MFEIFEYIIEQKKKQERKEARRKAVGKFFAGFFLSLLISVLVCGIFALVAYCWFKYVISPTTNGLIASIIISVFVFGLLMSVFLVAWYSGDDEDVD